MRGREGNEDATGRAKYWRWAGAVKLCKADCGGRGSRAVLRRESCLTGMGHGAGNWLGRRIHVGDLPLLTKKRTFFEPPPDRPDAGGHGLTHTRDFHLVHFGYQAEHLSR